MVPVIKNVIAALCCRIVARMFVLGRARIVCISLCTCGCDFIFRLTFTVVAVSALAVLLTLLFLSVIIVIAALNTTGDNLVRVQQGVLKYGVHATALRPNIFISAHRPSFSHPRDTLYDL